jgi:hypothetical protein
MHARLTAMELAQRTPLNVRGISMWQHLFYSRLQFVVCAGI